MKNLLRFPSILPAVLALLSIVSPLGCKSSAPTSDVSTNNAPSAPAASANQGVPSPSPNGSSAVQNQAVPAAPTKVTLTVQPGKEVHVRINETINAKTANVGDPFTGRLSSPLTTRSGETVFAQGTRVSGSVVSAKGQGRFAGAGV